MDKTVKKYNKLRILSILLFLIGIMMFLLLPIFKMDIEKIQNLYNWSNYDEYDIFKVNLFNKLNKLGLAELYGDHCNLADNIGAITFSLLEEFILSIEWLIKGLTIGAYGDLSMMIYYGVIPYTLAIIFTFIALVKTVIKRNIYVERITFFHSKVRMMVFSVIAFFISLFPIVFYIILGRNSSTPNEYLSCVSGVKFSGYLVVLVLLLSLLLNVINIKNKKVCKPQVQATNNEKIVEELDDQSKAGDEEQEVLKNVKKDKPRMKASAFNIISNLAFGLLLLYADKFVYGHVIISSNVNGIPIFKYIFLIGGILCVAWATIWFIVNCINDIRGGYSIYLGISENIVKIIRPIIITGVILSIAFVILVPFRFCVEKSSFDNTNYVVMINPITNKAYYMEMEVSKKEDIITNTVVTKTGYDLETEKDKLNGEQITVYHLKDTLIFVTSKDLKFDIFKSLKMFINGWLLGEYSEFATN